MKVLVITPHLSTGGQPQYLLKKLQHFSSEFQFSVIEWSNITGGQYIVQREQIQNLLSQNFFSLTENKHEVFSVIEGVKPDVIHFEEIPETFIDSKILDQIYDVSRSWKIVVTTHSSHTKPETLTYLADKFILVSEWSKNVFQNQLVNIPCEVWEYPIEEVKYETEEFRKKLNFSPEKKHILNVGLFTPGKNQGELIELARECEIRKLPIEFHFVGNQAINFRDYWLPLMQQLPSNCTVHGEKKNVDVFYKACDIFYFPSLMELNPISIKEAKSFKLPVFLKNLPTYSSELIESSHLISLNNEENIQTIKRILGL